MTDCNDVIPQPVNKVSWVLYDEYGNVKDTGMTMNQVQDMHDDVVAGQCDSTPNLAAGLYQYMHCGTGAIPATAGTDLTTPHGDARTAVTSSVAVAEVITTIATFPAGTCTGVLTEVGMFNTVATATLMCCATIAVTKAAGDSLTVTWTCTF